jgi:hypothetical protein
MVFGFLFLSLLSVSLLFFPFRHPVPCSNTTQESSPVCGSKEPGQSTSAHSKIHGEHEKHTRQRDANWPDWYAAYMVAEQSGKELPQ